VRRRLPSARLLVALATVFVAGAAHGQAARPVRLPPVDTVLAHDSIPVLSGRAGGSRPIAYRVLRVEGDRDWWVGISDGYGGQILVPLAYADFLVDAARSRIGGEAGRWVFSTRRSYAMLGLLLIGLGVLSLVVVPMMWSQRRYRGERQRRQLLQETARQLAESREDERLRIAQDLHDGPLQNLQALHMQLDLAAADIATSQGATSPTARRARGAQDETSSIIGEIRAIAEALRPPALGPFGLAAALLTHIDRFSRQHPTIEVVPELDADGQSLPGPIRIALFRIAQEALNNAARHAAPRRIFVTLRLTGRTVELTVADDGCGLPALPSADTLLDGRHFGVLGMRERAHSLNGSIVFGAREGGGTCIRVTIPLGAAAPEPVADGAGATVPSR